MIQYFLTVNKRKMVEVIEYLSNSAEEEDVMKYFLTVHERKIVDCRGDRVSF